MQNFNRKKNYLQWRSKTIEIFGMCLLIQKFKFERKLSSLQHYGVGINNKNDSVLDKVEWKIKILILKQISAITKISIRWIPKYFFYQ